MVMVTVVDVTITWLILVSLLFSAWWVVSNSKSSFFFLDIYFIFIFAMDFHGRVNVCDYFDHYHSNSFGWGSDLWNWIMSQCYLQHELNLRRWWLYRMVMGIVCELFFRIKAFKFDTILSNLKKINLFTKTGFAYVGGACVVNKRLEKVNSVAIIEDTGGFSGIIVAAHEVGHLWVINFNYLSHKRTTKKIL